MTSQSSKTNDFDRFWMPFTASERFRKTPRMIASAEGHYYTTTEGQRLFDGTGGLWCCNAGHGRARIVSAIQQQAERLDFAHSFNQSHPLAFEAANRIVDLAPGFDAVFFTNSGSEAVDTALKIALAYHVSRGEGQRRILVGREKAYHGINFGGLSVGGIGTNKTQFGELYPAALHMRHTGISENRFAPGRPPHGGELADDLERFRILHGGDRIAAVIVEPVAGAGGVYPAPVGYLERLREICTTNGILLIFDEVITGFGRLGTAFASQAFGVRPDIFTVAKGMTNATVPMGGVLVGPEIRSALRHRPNGLPDLAHGYTYSGHPLACAAAIATMDVYRDERLFENADAMSPIWSKELHALHDIPTVVDIRTSGLIAGIDLTQSDAVGAAGWAAFEDLWAAGLVVRPVGDTLALSPPLSINEDEISHLVETLRSVLGAM